MEQGP